MTIKYDQHQHVKEVLRTMMCGFFFSKKEHQRSFFIFRCSSFLVRLNRKLRNHNYPAGETHLLGCEDNNCICELWCKNEATRHIVCAYMTGIL